MPWARRLLFLLPTAIFLAAAIALYLGLSPERQPDSIPSVLLDKPPPNFELPPVEGLELPGLATQDLVGHPVTVVNVWASWCLPCRAEHAILTELAKEDGVHLVSIDYKDKPADARAFLAELGNPFAAIGADVDGRAGIEWGISGVPETFFIDAKGTIRYRHVGALDAVTLEEKIRPLLKEIAGP